MGTCPQRRRTHIAGGIPRCVRIGALCWPPLRCSSLAPDCLWWAPLPSLIHTIHHRVLYSLLLDSFALYRAPIMWSTFGWRPRDIEGLTSIICLCLHKQSNVGIEIKNKDKDNAINRERMRYLCKCSSYWLIQLNASKTRVYIYIYLNWYIVNLITNTRTTPFSVDDKIETKMPKKQKFKIRIVAIMKSILCMYFLTAILLYLYLYVLKIWYTLKSAKDTYDTYTPL